MSQHAAEAHRNGHQHPLIVDLLPSFPSYLCECIEWLGFALAAGGLFAPGLRWRGLPLLAPPALFALNIVSPYFTA